MVYLYQNEVVGVLGKENESNNSLDVKTFGTNLCSKSKDADFRTQTMTLSVKKPSEI